MGRKARHVGLDLPPYGSPGYFREWWRQSRAIALGLLGARCVRCGFDDPRALQFDHVKDDGFKDRKNGRGDAQRAVREILNGEREKYQILCANCNQIKRVESL